MQLRPGDQINHYTLLEPLGEGGQGSVWKVHDPREGGVVRALKIVSLAGANPSAFARARREARILAAASHPALVTCHGLFEERDGVVGLLMDLVQGRSLADVVEGRPLDWARRARPCYGTSRMRSPTSTPRASCIATSSRRTSSSRTASGRTRTDPGP